MYPHRRLPIVDYVPVTLHSRRSTERKTVVLVNYFKHKKKYFD